MAGAGSGPDGAGDHRGETDSSYRREDSIVLAPEERMQGSMPWAKWPTLRQRARWRPIPFRRRSTVSFPQISLVIGVEEVDEDFNARGSAKSKIYEYRILNREIRSVFHREYAWHIPQRLNLREMKKATRILIGEHDFSSFRSVGTPTKTAIRKVFKAEWKRNKEGFLQFEIEATGFLKQMVRAIVGTLVEVGKSKITVEEFRKILESKDRKNGGPTAPAHGLFMKEVKY